MPVSSLIVKARQGRSTQLCTSINQLEGATVTDVIEDRIVVVTSTLSPSEDKSIWDEINNNPETIQLDLIYHNFEDSGEEK